MNMKKRNLLLVFTGGTIASVQTENGLRPVLDAEEMLKYLPEIPEDICLSSVQICNIDSTNMTYREWLKIAAVIEENYQKYDGFVICHGTDTMAYTAAALSYLIQNSTKPIVLTGAQEPIQQEITDAKKNLMDSIHYAGDPESCGVQIVFNGKAIAGTRAKKTKSSSYSAFSSINFPEIATIRHGKIIRYLTQQIKGEVTFYHQMNPRVFAWKMTPGVTSEVLLPILHAYDAVIIESFGVGGIPNSLVDDLLSFMKTDEAKDKILIMTTQVTYEGSHMSTYEVGKRMESYFPFLEGFDMTFEAVLAKTMWLLGQDGMDREKFREQFYQKIAYDILWN